MPKIWNNFTHFSPFLSTVAMAMLLKKVSIDKISSHFRLKTKGQDEFIIKFYYLKKYVVLNVKHQFYQRLEIEK